MLDYQIEHIVKNEISVDWTGRTITYNTGKAHMVKVLGLEPTIYHEGDWNVEHLSNGYYISHWHTAKEVQDSEFRDRDVGKKCLVCKQVPPETIINLHRLLELEEFKIVHYKIRGLPAHVVGNRILGEKTLYAIELDEKFEPKNRYTYVDGAG